MSRICDRGASGFLVDAWSVPHILLQNEQNLREGASGFLVDAWSVPDITTTTTIASITLAVPVAVAVALITYDLGVRANEEKGHRPKNRAKDEKSEATFLQGGGHRRV